MTIIELEKEIAALEEAIEVELNQVHQRGRREAGGQEGLADSLTSQARGENTDYSQYVPEMSYMENLEKEGTQIWSLI